MELPPDLVALVRAGESPSMEFKLTVADEDDVAKALCAYANDLARCGGGWVLAGVRDDGEIVGLEPARVEKLRRRVAEVLHDQADPAIIYRETTWPLSTGAKVLGFRAERSDLVHEVRTRHGKGGAWVKLGADVVRLATKAQRRQMDLERGEPLAWAIERGVPAAKGTAPDASALARLLERLRVEARAEEALRPGVRLHAHLEPLIDARTEAPAGHAVLLAWTQPHLYVRGAFVEAAEYFGRERSGPTSALRRFEGNLEAQLHDACAWVHERAGLVVDRRLPTDQVNRSRVPDAAMREALANALAHRDYGIWNPVKLDLFEDRLEVTSPGLPPSGQALDLATPPSTHWRNPALREPMVALGMAQLRRQGLSIIRDASLAHTGRPAKVELNHGHVVVTVPLLVAPRREPGSSTLGGLVLALSTAAVPILDEVETELVGLGLGGLRVVSIHRPVGKLEEGEPGPIVEELAAACLRAATQHRGGPVHLFLRCPLVIAAAVAGALSQERALALYQRAEGGYYFHAVTLDRQFFGNVAVRSKA